MEPDINIIDKMNALAADFREEAEMHRIEANKSLESGDIKDYFRHMKKYGEYTMRQIEVIMMEIDITENVYDASQRIIWGDTSDA